jgi:hypothetical protein
MRNLGDVLCKSLIDCRIASIRIALTVLACFHCSDISNCEVVTEWAAGCSWNEALALADVPPGDLVRTLSRALDGLRQLGNLPFTPLRKGDLDESTLLGPSLPRGLHPEVRKLCRDAAKAINRYPVKDFLTFETGEQDENDGDDVKVTEDWTEGAESKSAPKSA